MNKSLVHIIFFSLFLLILPNNPFTYHSHPEYIRYLLSIFSVGLILIFLLPQILHYQKDKLNIQPSWFDLILFLFILAYLISTYFSIDRATSLVGIFGGNHGGLIFALILVLVFYFSRFFLAKQIKLLAIFASISALSSILISLIFHLDPGVLSGVRLAGPQFHPIAYAIFLLNCLFFALYLRNKFFNLIALVIFLLILATGTRSVWIALTASLLFGGLWLILISATFKRDLVHNFKHLIFISALSLAILVVLVFTWQSPLIRIQQAFGNPQDDPSVTIRLAEYKSILALIKDHPLGSGPDTLDLTYPQYRSSDMNKYKEWQLQTIMTRNIYLNYAANLGILPALLITSFFILILVFSIKLRLNLLLTLSFLASLIFNLFFNYTIISSIFLWMMAGILVGQMGQSIKTSLKFKLTFTKPLKLLSVAILIASSALGIVFATSSFYSELIFERAIYSYSRRPVTTIKIPFFDKRQAITLYSLESYYADLNQNNPRVSKLYTNNSLIGLADLLKTSPKDPKLLNEITVTRFRAFRVFKDKSLILSGLLDARSAYLLSPSDPRQSDNLGEFYLALGDLDNAEHFFRIDIDLKPDFFPAYYHLGEVYKQRGKFDQAINYYQQSFQYGGYSDFSLSKIKEIQDLKNQLEKNSRS